MSNLHQRSLGLFCTEQRFSAARKDPHRTTTKGISLHCSIWGMWPLFSVSQGTQAQESGEFFGGLCCLTYCSHVHYLATMCVRRLTHLMLVCPPSSNHWKRETRQWHLEIDWLKKIIFSSFYKQWQLRTATPFLSSNDPKYQNRLTWLFWTGNESEIGEEQNTQPL